VNIHSEEFPDGEIRGQIMFNESLPTDLTTVRIMKHLCNESIGSVSDLVAIQNNASNDTEAFMQILQACPTITLPNDTASPDAVSGGNFDFAFEVTGDDNETSLQTASEFVQNQLCVDGNDCLDTSYYAFNASTGNIVVTETMAPENSTFGIAVFTPTGLDINNDEASLESISSNGVITLNTTNDIDKIVTLHVVNIMNTTA
jgi:hypothetical protein